MGNSLRDALREAGLVGEERKPKPKPRRSPRGKSATARKRAIDEREIGEEAGAKPAAAPRRVLKENQRRTARFVRDATLVGGSVAENAKKARRRKIQALIESERRNDDRADIAYHFVKGKRIKRIYVTEAQRDALASGGLVIAALEGHHHLLTPAAAGELAELAPQTVITSGVDEGAAEADAEDGPPVPDDISW